MSDLPDRLNSPARLLTLEELAETWFEVVVGATLPGYGALADDLRLLRRLRGSLGDVLKNGASAACIKGEPCDFEPPCTLDVLFREQGRIGPHGIPKPFVITAERQGRDLRVSVSLFGLAADWSSTVQHALVEVLAKRIRWKAQHPGLFLPLLKVTDVSVVPINGVVLDCVPDQIELLFETPVVAEGDHPKDTPSTLIARLARRIDGLARWQDARLDVDWHWLCEKWRTLSYETIDLESTRMLRRSTASMQDYETDVVGGSVHLTGDLAPIWPLLVLGTRTRLGKGANAGFGRYRLVPGTTLLSAGSTTPGTGIGFVV